MRSIASRLWPDRVRIALCADRVAGVRFARGRPRKIVRREELPVAVASLKASWKEPVRLLQPCLAALGATRASVEVILSGRFARYVLLPASAALRSEADWESFARQRLADLGSVDAAPYAVLLSPGGHAARLACAVPEDLVTETREALAAGGHRLATLRPHFAAFFDGERAAANAAGAWFVADDGTQLTIALATNGEWRTIRQRRSERHWLDDLPAILDRESMLAGTPAVETVLVAALLGDLRLPERAGRYVLKSVARP